jgi:hypothetical protein
MAVYNQDVMRVVMCHVRIHLFVVCLMMPSVPQTTYHQILG